MKNQKVEADHHHIDLLQDVETNSIDRPPTVDAEEDHNHVGLLQDVETTPFDHPLKPKIEENHHRVGLLQDVELLRNVELLQEKVATPQGHLEVDKEQDIVRDHPTARHQPVEQIHHQAVGLDQDVDVELEHGSSLLPPRTSHPSNLGQINHLLVLQQAVLEVDREPVAQLPNSTT